ncbi:MAG TPA: OmpH family outer membrane protein [Thermoanaerobaculia bacterium]
MKKFALSVLAMLLAIPMFAQTAPPARVAVIEVSKVLSQSNAGKAALDRLRKLQEEKASRAKKMDEELKALDGQIKQKQMSLTEEKLAELRKQFSERGVALERFAQDAERELGQARDQSLKELEKQLMPVINTIGKEMGFAAIFNKYESGLVYAADAIDITDVVIKRFNDTTAKPEQAAAAPKQ